MNNAQTLLSMPGVGFFGMLVIGIIAGYIAEKATASDHGLLTNLLVGIAGSFVGGTLANLMHVEFYGWLGNLIVASVGAILVLWVWRRLRDRHRQADLASMVVVIGQADVKARPRHPEKARLPDTPVLPKPPWIRVKAPGAHEFDATRAVLRAHRLVTVCEEAACPNIGECWGKRHATFMIMGDTCTRACAFCNVRTGKPGALDAGEPARVAEAVAALGLAHVVVTSVDRDDLADGGAAHFAATIRAIRAGVPDDQRSRCSPRTSCAKTARSKSSSRPKPDVFNHNIETVPSLYRRIRPGADYRALARSARSAPRRSTRGIFTKSGIMVGLGEEAAEVHGR